MDKSRPKSRPGHNGGGTLIAGQGRGPKKGAPNAGRPKNEFLAWCSTLLNDPQCRSQVEAVVKDKAHPAFSTMWSRLAERVHGKPEQKINLDGEIRQIAIVRRREA